jgi:hypothetical protein
LSNVQTIIIKKGVENMIYYRVKKSYDQAPKNPRYHDGNFFIAGELYTAREVDQLPFIYSAAFEVVEVPKNQTYWFFGARFQMYTYQQTKEIYHNLKEMAGKAELVTEEAIRNDLGNQAFESLRHHGFIECCGVIQGRKMYAI